MGLSERRQILHFLLDGSTPELRNTQDFHSEVENVYNCKDMKLYKVTSVNNLFNFS